MPTQSYIDVSPLNVVSSLADDISHKPLSEEEVEEIQKRNDQRSFLQNIAKVSFHHAADSRRRYDYEWMVRDLFRRGYMFSRYQPTTQTIMLASRQTARIPINITNAQMMSIASQVTSFRPKFECMPRNTTTVSQVQARYSGKILDYYHEHLHMKKKIKETVIEGLMFSVGGPWIIAYDEEKKEVVIYKADPFDFYFDSLAVDPDEAEFQILAHRTPLGSIVYNEDYDPLARAEIRGGESRLATSEYKQFMLQALKYVTQYNTAESPAVILFEGFFRIREDGKKPYLRKVVWTDQNSIPLLWEDYDGESYDRKGHKLEHNNEYDTILYQADLNPNEVYGEGWMKHVMPLNRVLNSLESSTFDYNYKVAKGRIVVDKDSGVRAIHNQHGEIISKKRGSEVRAMDMPALPSAVGQQIERVYQYQEDISGVHSASLGRMPPGSRSGQMLTEMKQADSTNQDLFVDNLEDFLTLVGQKILKKIAKHYDSVHILEDLGYKGEEAKYFAVAGKNWKSKKADKEEQGKFRIGADVVDITQIGEDNNVRVTIGSWLGYTKEALIEKVIKMFQLGLIDQGTALRAIEFGEVDKIVQQTRMSQMLKSRLGQQPGGIQPVDPYVENDMMVLERKPVMPDMHDDHYIHIAVHQEALGQGSDDLVGNHIAAHEAYLASDNGIDNNTDTQQNQQQQGGMSQEDQLRNQQVAQQAPQVNIQQPAIAQQMGK